MTLTGQAGFWHVRVGIGVTFQREYWSGRYGKGRAQHAIDKDGYALCTGCPAPKAVHGGKPINCKLCLRILHAWRGQPMLTSWLEDTLTPKLRTGEPGQAYSASEEAP